jgi:integrase/recombinase XerD
MAPHIIINQININIIKLNILFIDKSKLNKKGECPLKFRITYLKQRKQISTGLFVSPKHWNSKKQKVLDNAAQSDYINTQLSLIINKINHSFILLQIQVSNFSLEDIYIAFKGEK